MNRLEHNPARNPFTLDTPAPARLGGTVRRPGMGYALRLAWDGLRLTGRLGGRFFGENVSLEAHTDQVLGSASGARALTLHGSREGDLYRYRLVGAQSPVSAELRLRGGYVTGHVRNEGRAVPVEWNLGDKALALGDEEDPQRVELEPSGDPLPPLVLLAAVLLADTAAREAWRVWVQSYGGLGEA